MKNKYYAMNYQLITSTVSTKPQQFIHFIHFRYLSFLKIMTTDSW